MNNPDFHMTQPDIVLTLVRRPKCRFHSFYFPRIGIPYGASKYLHLSNFLCFVTYKIRLIRLPKLAAVALLVFYYSSFPGAVFQYKGLASNTLMYYIENGTDILHRILKDVPERCTHFSKDMLLLMVYSLEQRFPTCAPRSPKGSACTSQGLRGRSRKIK